MPDLVREALSLPADFSDRHCGPRAHDAAAMLAALGYDSIDALCDATVPSDIRLNAPLRLPEPLSEFAAAQRLRTIAAQNRIARSMIGMGYYGTITPPVIQRSILENPLWYTPYTPYQAEIAQGRLEALLNFQTMVADLTGMAIANASLLDEATAAAEAMAMCYSVGRGKRPVFVAASNCHPQTLSVVATRAKWLGIELRIAAPETIDWQSGNVCGVLVQYPGTDGEVEDFGALAERAHASGALLVVATDLLALTLLRPPGEFGADIVVGSSQRFGVPMGFGGPHAAFLATHEEHVRRMPGRLVGVSRDAHGNQAYRLSIQTREQHIRRDKATSNICTAQVLLAIIASMYAVYHGPDGLRRIARRVHRLTELLARGLSGMGVRVATQRFFDTIVIEPAGGADAVLATAAAAGINLRRFSDRAVAVSFDETTTSEDVESLLRLFADGASAVPALDDLSRKPSETLPAEFVRTGEILTHPVFRSFHAEHEMLRYITRLQNKDVSLANSMIPLGSCTMKLNAAAEMMPVTWPEFANIHPFAPEEQTVGYRQMIGELCDWLAEVTGFARVSMQPNAGSQGEYAGLLAIARYHQARGDHGRDVCLIPVSAHGTNPASAVIAGMRVVAVACRANGDVDVDDLRQKAATHSKQLAALMITYPSTHGVFEPSVREVCAIVHEHGGQVYMDGANMNAQVGLCRPGDIGADVCHLNLHKTFCIPHGGGGPGMGPIGVAAHLADFLPGHPIGGEGAVSAAPFGSPMILPIPWMYVQMMGAAGLKRATQTAILNANYMAQRLREHYEVLFTGPNGRVAHEFILDCRGFEKSAGVTVEDIAKRLIDFGFHAPTMSFPVAGTLMIEPTESESRAELDRLCDALIVIRSEIAAVEKGELQRGDNPLKHAPHTAAAVSSDDWSHAYSRSQAAYPAPWLRDAKYWPPVGRIDNAFGDRNLICSCPPMDSYGA